MGSSASLITVIEPLRRWSSRVRPQIAGWHSRSFRAYIERAMTAPILTIVGARPNFMKAAPVHRAFEARGIEHEIIHTGQHYDDAMSKVFFDDLGMPKPSVYLGVGSGSHAVQTANVMIGLEKVFLEKA